MTNREVRQHPKFSSELGIVPAVLQAPLIPLPGASDISPGDIIRQQTPLKHTWVHMPCISCAGNKVSNNPSPYLGRYYIYPFIPFLNNHLNRLHKIRVI